MQKHPDQPQLPGWLWVLWGVVAASASTLVALYMRGAWLPSVPPSGSRVL